MFNVILVFCVIVVDVSHLYLKFAYIMFMHVPTDYNSIVLYDFLRFFLHIVQYKMGLLLHI